MPTVTGQTNFLPIQKGTHIAGLQALNQNPRLLICLVDWPKNGGTNISTGRRWRVLDNSTDGERGTDRPFLHLRAVEALETIPRRSPAVPGDRSDQGNTKQLIQTTCIKLSEGLRTTSTNCQDPSFHWHFSICLPYVQELIGNRFHWCNGWVKT